jgi:L-lactate utilization protein LutB
MHKDLQFLKTRANFIRYSYIEEMEKHLLAFESKLFSNNIVVKWLGEEDKLVEFICNSMSKNNYNKVCFDIPKIPDAFFEKKNFIKEISIESCEKNEETVENLIIKADFGVVENGSIVFINSASKNCFNNVEKIFIILNINDLVIRLNDLDILLYLRHGIEQAQNINDVKILSSPPSKIKAKKFQTTPEENNTAAQIELFLLLYDNGITEILKDEVLRETLYCIHCNNCMKVCPVYKQTGQFSPIELIKFHCKEENKRNTKLFENTSLCGNCNDICPVQINFTQHIIHQMKNFAKRNNSHEKSIDLFKVLSKRSKMNKKSSKIRRFFFVNKYYGKNKKLANYLSSSKEEFFNISQKETEQK